MLKPAERNAGPVRVYSAQSRLGAARGFGLIELMIALVLGLVVSGSVVAFIGSIVRANAQTVRVTRLNQELRSASEMIGRELRRSQSVSDPLVNVGNPTGGTGHVSSVVTNVAGSCITYAYGGSGQGNFRAIWRDANGNIEFARGNAAQACTDSNANPQLNSQLVNITAMTVTQTGPNCQTAAAGGACINLTLRGQMRNDTMAKLGDEAANPVTRTYQSSFQIRTTAVP